MDQEKVQPIANKAERDDIINKLLDRRIESGYL